MSLGDHDLDVASPVANVQEEKLACGPEQHDPARDANDWPNFLARALTGFPALVIKACTNLRSVILPFFRRRKVR